MKKIRLLTLIYLTSVLFSPVRMLSAQLTGEQKKLLGFWQATVEGTDFTDIFVYYFFSGQNSKLCGVCYAFRNGKKKNETAIDSVSFHRKSVYLKFHGTFEIEYKGYFIAENHTIGGKLFYPDSTSVPWVLKKISVKSIDEIFSKDHLK